MQEEFHGDGIEGGKRKLLYGWGTMNVNIWLPSLSELVGIDTKNYHAGSGIYFPAMQGISMSGAYHVMKQGGDQFAWFKQLNISGGGSAIWNAVQKQTSWTRSTGAGHSNLVAVVRSLDTLNFADVAADSLAVHPAVWA